MLVTTYLSLPAATCCDTSIGLANIIPMCPATRSVTAGPPPLYGTCVKSVPVRSLKSSVARCGTLPLPGEPYMTVPGFALPRASSSCGVLTPTDGCTVRMSGDDAISATPVKSLAAS